MLKEKVKEWRRSYLQQNFHKDVRDVKAEFTRAYKSHNPVNCERDSMMERVFENFSLASSATAAAIMLWGEEGSNAAKYGLEQMFAFSPESPWKRDREEFPQETEEKILEAALSRL